MEAEWTSTRRRVNGVDLHVVEAGPTDGPLAVLLHGFPDFWWSWRSLIPALVGRGFRVVAPDQRGYNLSDRPRAIEAYRLDELVGDVTALVDAYGRDTFALVGHDWGGIVAWEVALRFPERVQRLVVIDAPLLDTVSPVVRRHPSQALRSAYVAVFQLPRVPETLLAARRFALLKRAMVVASGPGVFSPTDLNRYVEAWSQPWALTAMLAWYRALRFFRPMGRGRVLPPVLVIWGGRDPFLDRHLYQASLDRCVHGQGLFLADVGHWPHLEMPSMVEQEIIRFIGAT